MRQVETLTKFHRNLQLSNSTSKRILPSFGVGRGVGRYCAQDYRRRRNSSRWRTARNRCQASAVGASK